MSVSGAWFSVDEPNRAALSVVHARQRDERPSCVLAVFPAAESCRRETLRINQALDYSRQSYAGHRSFPRTG